MTTDAIAHEFLWLDLETTGLINAKPGGLYAFGDDAGHILEFAAVLAADDRAGDLSVVQAYEGAVHYDAPEAFAMDPFVLKMHTDNGLFADCRASTISLADADEFLYGLCCELAGNKRPRGITLAGNSVHFDLQWVRVHMPLFASALHHRVFDVSTLQRAAMINVEGYEPLRANAHRALDDLYQSLAAYKAWREAVGL